MAGLWDRLRGRETFAQWNSSNPAFAEWWLGTDDSSEIVNASTVLGLSAVLRSVQIISSTIAGLPFRTYEREGEEKIRMPSDFDDPWPGIDGMTPFSWMETVLIHLLLWRHAFLWHGTDGARVTYQPINPDIIVKVYRDGSGKRQFDYYGTDQEIKTVGSEQITYIPGPSLDGTVGHPLLYGAKAIFSAALSGDRGAQATLRRSIRLGGILVPAEGEEYPDKEEGDAILESLRSKVVGREHSGDIALINRRYELKPWAQNNQDMQWIETRKEVLGDVERLFGVPPHLLADTEKQTSWGTGVAEQNLGLARYTLRGWSDRIEQVLSLRLPQPGKQFCEFDYKGLLQGTPAQEIELLLLQTGGKPILTVDEARKIANMPPLTAAQKAELEPEPAPEPIPIRKEAAA